MELTHYRDLHQHLHDYLDRRDVVSVSPWKSRLKSSWEAFRLQLRVYAHFFSELKLVQAIIDNSVDLGRLGRNLPIALGKDRSEPLPEG